MLRNPDEKTLERLSSEYPQAEQNHKDKMYEKVKERMNNNDNVFTEEVHGVEKYTRRHLWKMVPAAVMSVALLGGAVGGGVIMLKNNRSSTPSAEISAETTTLNSIETTANGVIDETNAVQGNAQSDVTKDLIFSICENGRTQNFDQISYSYEIRYDYDTGYHDEKNGEIKVDNIQNIASETLNTGYYRKDGSTVHKTSSTEYTCNGKTAGIYEYYCDSPDEDNNRKEFHIDENGTLDHVINEALQDGMNLLENFDDWDIVGIEEYLGRRCAVISGTTETAITYESSPDQEADSDICTCEYTIFIDTETGVWMKGNIKHTDFDLEQCTFAITDIGYGDSAKSPMSKDEFKQYALDGCFKGVYDGENENPISYEPVNESDLAFLN